jgi:2-keto-4-pentenoate hydratase/2-oxohepta-3-ene-1,7-dioic acid hydratase in catechol pathway
MSPPFKLASVEQQGAQRAALIVEDQWVDLAAALRGREGAPAASGEPDLLAMLRDWAAWRPWLGELAVLVASQGPRYDERLSPDPATLRLPFMPHQVWLAAANYYGHVTDMGGERPDKSKQQPLFLYKPLSSVIGPNDPIVAPPEVTQLDWEAEIAVVIGRTARRVGVDRALDYVAGYTIMNDVSARDQGRRSDYPPLYGLDWLGMKGWDTFGPLGPWLLPAQFVPDPQALTVKLWLNDTLQQDFPASDMIHSVREQIAWLSGRVTLVPGDVIATGTGEGCGRPRGIALRPGDHVTIEIEPIGRLENPVRGEEAVARRIP